MSDRPRLYDVDAASAITHYAPESIRRLCEKGVLVRGEDFIICTYRTGRYFRQVRAITAAGISRLITRRSRPINRLYDTRASIPTSTETSQAAQNLGRT